MGVLLAIDVGNTNIVIGAYRGETLVRTWRAATDVERTEDELAVMIDGLLAREELGWRRDAPLTAIEASIVGTPDQRSLALKRIWRRMPLYLRPFLYFLYRYFLRLGILDVRDPFR